MSNWLAELQHAIGMNNVLLTSEATTPYLQEWRQRYEGSTKAVLLPENTEAVAKSVKICADHGVAIVAQGGNTGLVGGAIPYPQENAVILSLKKLNKIRTIDAISNHMVVEAGCILQNVQQAAAEHQRLFPLSLGAEGSCMIGGNIATNAGGIHTIGYGNMRDLVLGLEVVLANGQIWNHLQALHKDNSGYDMKHLLIGSEGTLGIITAATVRLYPRPKQLETIFIAITNPQAALNLLVEMQENFAQTLTAFELIPQMGLNLAMTYGQCRNPLGALYPWYVLAEFSDSSSGTALAENLQQHLAIMLEKGMVLDVAISQQEEQRKNLWLIREQMVLAQKREGASIKHDVSVPILAVPHFIEEAGKLVHHLIEGARPFPFGHMGDGNIHYNISQPVGGDAAAFLSKWEEVNRSIHDLVLSLQGSMSAEHGVGRAKIAELQRTKPAVDMAMMYALKRALDPKGILNPGKMLDFSAVYGTMSHD